MQKAPSKRYPAQKDQGMEQRGIPAPELSKHTKEDATFNNEFWSKLGVNKAENEKEFISAIKEVTLVKRISYTQSIWTMYYTSPPSVSPGVFTILQTIHLDESSPKTRYGLLNLPLRRPCRPK
ncbi:hypothetical protein K503DRAFT_31597 [Rhizopogon vinicolor AM-OR11-026]|uniref:Uncharacterized protein n=1 Tax=Rhizopogon vinicolor AM-OR11-026 TaxID=1314800 RepID=A0A1B7MH70_9AGAM|nr:hypothetical protein K503DRAFT_31597 [Rhizopogon vinicolor AM-OR11-026]